MEEYSGGSREAFRETINKLKEIANQAGIEISDEAIAANLDISLAKFIEYYNNDWAPEDLFPLLREKYHDFIGGLSIHHIWMTDVKEVDDPDPDSEEDDVE